MPAAGEFLGAAAPIRFRESQAGKHAPGLCLKRIAVALAELGVESMEALAHALILFALGIEFGHLSHQIFHLLLHGQQVAEHRHAFGQHRASGKRQAVLREVARSDPLSEADFAVIERIEARQHLEQSALARAVRSHQANARAWRDEPIEILKQQFGAESLSGR